MRPLLIIGLIFIAICFAFVAAEGGGWPFWLAAGVAFGGAGYTLTRSPL